jgi:galactokinase
MSNNETGKTGATEMLLQQCCRDFFVHYGERPEWAVAAPGRVNLIGEHTDYNDGFVLPMAIERYVVMVGRKATNVTTSRMRIVSASIQSTVEIPYETRPIPGEPKWANYLRGVIAGFIDRGISPPSIDAMMVSNVPLGGGLSSSAAVEVATATLLELACKIQLNKHEKARLCRKAEHDFAKVPCGIMDQLISVLGHQDGVVLIDCRAESARAIPFKDPSVSVLVTNTNVRHSLSSGEYGTRRLQCCDAAHGLGLNSLRDATLLMLDANLATLNEIELKRARHVITENERTVSAAEALERGDMTGVGRLMYQSHASLRDDYEVSCRELDVLVESAEDMGERLGVLGARMTGGGFGGCTVTLVRTDCIDEVMARLAAEYRHKTDRVATSFVSRPARGAHQLELSPDQVA